MASTGIAPPNSAPIRAIAPVRTFVPDGVPAPLRAVCRPAGLTPHVAGVEGVPMRSTHGSNCGARALPRPVHTGAEGVPTRGAYSSDQSRRPCISSPRLSSHRPRVPRCECPRCSNGRDLGLQLRRVCVTFLRRACPSSPAYLSHRLHAPRSGCRGCSDTRDLRL